MEQNNYGSGGSLNPREKKSERAAGYGGKIYLVGEELDYVLACAERGEKVQLELSGWKREGQNGQFISLKVQTPYEVRQGQQQQQRQPRPNPQPQRQGFPTSRGMYPPQDQQQRNGYAEARGRPAPQRSELNDEIPDFGRRRAPEPPPWE